MTDTAPNNNTDTTEANPNPSASRKNNTWIWIAAIAAVVGLGIWIWEDYLEDRVVPKRWGVVVPGEVYRSGRLHRDLVKRTLEKYNIQLVIDLSRVEGEDPDQQAEIQAVEELGIERLHFPIESSKGEGCLQYAKALKAITDAQAQGKPVLIHCVAGVQRTGLCTAFYRMLLEDTPPDQAYQEMLRYRWNPADDHVVLKHINESMPIIVESLKDEGVIDEIPDPLPVLAPAQ